MTGLLTANEFSIFWTNSWVERQMSWYWGRVSPYKLSYNLWQQACPTSTDTALRATSHGSFPGIHLFCLNSLHTTRESERFSCSCAQSLGLNCFIHIQFNLAALTLGWWRVTASLAGGIYLTRCLKGIWLATLMKEIFYPCSVVGFCLIILRTRLFLIVKVLAFILNFRLKSHRFPPQFVFRTHSLTLHT